MRLSPKEENDKWCRNREFFLALSESFVGRQEYLLKQEGLGKRGKVFDRADNCLSGFPFCFALKIEAFSKKQD